MSLLYDEPRKGFKIAGKTLTISLCRDKDGKRHKVLGELEVSPTKFHQVEVQQIRMTKDHGGYHVIFTIKRPEPRIRPVKK